MALGSMFTISRGTYCTISMVMKCRYCALVDIVEPTLCDNFGRQRQIRSANYGVLSEGELDFVSMCTITKEGRVTFKNVLRCRKFFQKLLICLEFLKISPRARLVAHLWAREISTYLVVLTMAFRYQQVFRTSFPPFQDCSSGQGKVCSITTTMHSIIVISHCVSNIIDTGGRQLMIMIGHTAVRRPLIQVV